MVFMDEGPWYPSLELPQEPSTLKSLASHVKTLVDGVRFASTWHTLFMLLLSCLATFLCTKGMLDMSFDTSMSIVAVGTVFPLVFSVQASFQRRERALAALASLKAAIFTIYLMFKTWEIESTGKWASEVEELLHKLLDDIEHFLRHPNRPDECSCAVYDGFATLARKMNDFGPAAGYSKGGESGMGRMAASLEDMLRCFEAVRAVRDTETPVGLRLFCFALIHTAPVLLAPYWAHFCDKQRRSALAPYGCEASYYVASAFVLIAMTLHRVQVELEECVAPPAPPPRSTTRTLCIIVACVRGRACAGGRAGGRA